VPDLREPAVAAQACRACLHHGRPRIHGAAFRLFPWYSEDRIKTPFFDHEALSQSVSALLFVALCLYLWFNSVRRTKEEEA